jgi:hypothetical protein
MHQVTGYSMALGIALASATASAQGKVDNIGNAGGIVIGGERLAGFYLTEINARSERTETVGGTTITNTTDVDTDRTTFAVFGHDATSPSQLPRLALDFFPVGGFSVGGSFSYLATSADQKGKATSTVDDQPPSEREIDDKLPTESLVVVNPRIGYAVAFNETVGLWPRVGFSYERLKIEREITVTTAPGNEQTYEQTTTVTFTHLTLEGLLFVSPFTGFAFVGGPFADIGLGGSAEFTSTEPDTDDTDSDTKLTAYGLTIGIAGYFDTQ